jgi:hypothetical protein
VDEYRKHSNTSNIVRFVLRHSITGQGLTGLSNASSGLIIATITDNEAATTTYTVAGSNVETITTLATYAAPTSGKCRFKEVDATNHKGLYEFQFADARFSVSSARSLRVSVTGATNLLDAHWRIALVQFDPYDSVRAGLTALPNAAAEASGGLYTRGTGAGQINQPANGMVDGNVVRWLGTAASTPTVAGVPNVNVKTWNDLTTVALPLVPTTAGRTLDVSTGGEAGVDWANVGSPTTSLALTGTTIATTQQVDVNTIKTQSVTLSGGVTIPAATLASTTNITAGTITTASNLTTNNDKTGYGLSSAAVQAIWDALTSALTTSGSIGKYLLDHLVGTLASGTHNAQSGDAYARLGAPVGASISADVAAVQSDTDNIQTRLPAALVGGKMDSTGGGLDAAATRAALGMASANLDTQLDALPTNAELATALGTADDATLAAIAALNNLSAAQVNAEVVDALATDTYAEPGQGAPAATTSLAAKINYLYKSWRNKKDGNGMVEQLYADNGTTVDQKATVAESAGVVTKSEVVSGP